MNVLERLLIEALAKIPVLRWHNSVARWSRPISTDERVEKAPFTVILAIINVVEGCNKS